jgi:glycerate dehydrogenase
MKSDIITLHSPLMPATRNMIGKAEFSSMERRPLLVNTARGGLVDEHALFDALTSGQISGAGFDVVTAEPPPADHVMMKLLARPDFILTGLVARIGFGQIFRRGYRFQDCSYASQV